MNILVTGANGFLGSNLLRWHDESGEESQLVLLSSKPVDDYPCVLHDGYRFQVGDFTAAGIDRIDVVIALGAYVQHGADTEAARKHLSSIVNLDYLLQHLPNEPDKVVYCSSVAVYGFDSAIPYNPNPTALYSEKSPTNPTRTYAISKLLGERIVEEWCCEHGSVAQIVRLGSVYGPGRRFFDFLGSIVNAQRKRELFTMYAPPHQRWNFVYADDVARWLFKAARLESSPGVINLVSAENPTSLEVLDTVSAVDPSFRWETVDKGGFVGNDKAFDNAKCCKLLGSERFTLNEGLRRVLLL